MENPQKMMEKPAWGRQERRDLPIWEKQIAVLVGYTPEMTNFQPLSHSQTIQQTRNVLNPTNVLDDHENV